MGSKNSQSSAAKIGVYHVAPGHSVTVARGEEYVAGASLDLDRAAGDDLVALGLLIRGPGQDRLALEAVAETASAPPARLDLGDDPAGEDGKALPKSLKPTGKARKGTVEIRRGVEIAALDILARAWADFDGTVKEWNAAEDAIADRLAAAADAILAERHPELADAKDESAEGDDDAADDDGDAKDESAEGDDDAADDDGDAEDESAETDSAIAVDDDAGLALGEGHDGPPVGA